VGAPAPRGRRRSDQLPSFETCRPDVA
jgi:hypothetical protein